jgi:hypothetical protein
MAEMGTHPIRIANLPPETSERAVRIAFALYEEIVSLHDEVWSNMYRYGIRLATMKLVMHLPSHMIIPGVLWGVDCFVLRLWRNRPYARDVSKQAKGITNVAHSPRLYVAATGNPIQRNNEEGKGETNFQDTEGANTQFQSMKEMVPFEKTDQTTNEKTQVTPPLRRDRKAKR